MVILNFIAYVYVIMLLEHAISHDYWVPLQLGQVYGAPKRTGKEKKQLNKLFRFLEIIFHSLEILFGSLEIIWFPRNIISFPRRLQFQIIIFTKSFYWKQIQIKCWRTPWVSVVVLHFKVQTAAYVWYA